MKRLAFGVFLALVLVGALSAQPPSGPSISAMADTIHVDHPNGRTVFTGDVVIAIDGTEITTKDVAVYDPATNTIELANGIVRVGLAGKPTVKLAARRSITKR
jgi:lipopolysaccharide export system protein LptA